MINPRARFVVSTLSRYARECQQLPRGTSDLSPLEEWLILELYHYSITSGASISVGDSVIEVVEETHGEVLNVYASFKAIPGDMKRHENMIEYTKDFEMEIRREKWYRYTDGEFNYYAPKSRLEKTN